MKKEIDVPFILDILKKIGDEFYKGFKQTALPADEVGFYSQFTANEEKCLSFIQSQLNSKYPEIPFSDGEFDNNEQKKPLPVPEYWICDAMDGAIQYIRHLPGWTINLVLIREGSADFAAIYDPMQQEMYWAKKGQGAYLNGELLQIKSKPASRFLLATFDHSSSAEKTNGLTQRVGQSVHQLLQQYAIVRNFGPHGLQLAAIATGRIDIFCEEGLDTYNWLPGILIAQEAGAQISTTDGRDWSWGEDNLFVAAPGIVESFIAQSEKS